MSPQPLTSPAPSLHLTTPVPRHDGPTRVLLAEDDEALRDTLASALRAEGYHVIEVPPGLELRDRLRQSLSPEGLEPPPDLVISDVHRSGDSGLDVLAWLRAQDWPLPVILITATGDADSPLEAVPLGASSPLDMPLDVDDLVFAATLLAEPR